MALPMIDAAVADREISGGGFLHIVIMDPALGPAHASFESAVLLEHSIGDPTKWDADYAAFARAKARLSWTSGLDGKAIQAARPHMLRQGDSLLWGSVCLDGIVVGVSGAHPWFDEAFATSVAASLRAFATQRHMAALQLKQTVADLPRVA